MATLQASLLIHYRTSLPFASHTQRHHPLLSKFPHSLTSLSPCKLSPPQFLPRPPVSLSRKVASQPNPSAADFNFISNETAQNSTTVVDGEGFDPSIGADKGEIAKEDERSSISKDDERLSVAALFEGARESCKKAFAQFMNWLPLWQQERRLARLIIDAEANPNDVAKQTALLVELNKHRFGLNRIAQ